MVVAAIQDFFQVQVHLHRCRKQHRKILFTISVSSSPNLSQVNVAPKFRYGLPERSIAESTSTSSIGSIKCPYRLIPFYLPVLFAMVCPSTIPVSSIV